MNQEDWTALLPDTPTLSQDQIDARMGGLQFTLSEEKELHFTMLAPRGLTWRDSHNAKCPPGTLASLVDDPARPAVEIRVTADGLQREMSPAEWVKSQLERAGHAILVDRRMDTPIGDLADILSEVEGPDGRHLARTNMAKDGDRIFTITCQAREDIYRARAHELLVTLSSFKLLHPEKAPLAEPLGTFTEIAPVVFGFRYPASWRMVEEGVSADACAVRLDNYDGDRRAGLIYVELRTTPQARKLVSAFFDRLAKAGVKVEGRPAPSPCEPKEGFRNAASLVAPATYNGEEFEIRAHILENEAATLLVALGGPARAISPDWWAINKRAFEIVLGSIYAV